MKKPVLKPKTIILLDVHLSMGDSKAKEIAQFLKHTHCETLILNGDIFDTWSLKRRKGIWSKYNSRFIRMVVLKKIERKETQVIYLRGNHGGVLRKFMPIHSGDWAKSLTAIVETWTAHLNCSIIRHSSNSWKKPQFS